MGNFEKSSVKFHVWILLILRCSMGQILKVTSILFVQILASIGFLVQELTSLVSGRHFGLVALGVVNPIKSQARERRGFPVGNVFYVVITPAR